MISRALTDEQRATIDAKAREAGGIAARIWAKDDTVWGPAGQEEVANRLGWLDIADRLRAEADDLVAFARTVAEDGLSDVVLLGMGGSSLAPEVLRLSNEPADGFLRLHVLDSTDAGAVAATAGGDRPGQHAVPRLDEVGRHDRDAQRVSDVLGAQADGAHFVAITDPGSASSPSPRSTTSAARSSTTRTSAGATPRCRTSGSCPRR
jgi:hypothetical protein